MAGTYIHIPFCRKACHYCNFHFSTTHSLLPQMIEAICREIELRKSYLKESIRTIYFGGGTPSICSNEQLTLLFDSLKASFVVNQVAEITLEANPDDITMEKLLFWKSLGINRLSIGIQSFREEDLRWMNRAHNAYQAIDCIKMAQKAGFENMSIDLIYGTPTLTDEQWEQNVKQAIELQIPHLSCYALTVESKTALDKMIQLKKTEEPDPEKQARHFELLMQWLEDAGYEHYEISNFAIKGRRSQHNSSYWQGEKYIGLGPSAHSFDGHSRQWNVANNALYLQSIASDQLNFEMEELTPTQTLNEYIMTSLRTIEGLSFEHIRSNWGNDKLVILQNSVREYQTKGHVEEDESSIRLSKSGKLLADGIAADLFFI